jgi:hypothetical protein
MSFGKILILISLIVVTTSCAKHTFENVTSEMPETPLEDKFESFSKTQSTVYSPMQVSFTQDQHDRNRTQVMFQVIDRLGRGVMGLTAADFEARENGVDFSRFTIDSSSQNLGKKVDIVFVLDVTNSMEQVIQEVKSKVRDFAESFRLQRVDGTLCLVTFRDSTVKKCLVLTQDNPNTPNNENIDQFFEDISAARTKPAGDWQENQLRGVIDAAVSTPWRDMAQRMAVLITNSNFSYSPGNTGNAGSNAPTYQDTVQTLIDRGVTVFTIGPRNTPGYDRRFSNQLDAMHAINNGKYYQYSKVLSGEIRMEDIFNQIIDAVAANYKLNYTVEEQPGLSPELPLHGRNVLVEAKNQEFRVKKIATTSNQPNGRPELKRQFRLSRPARLVQKSFRVRVAGQVVPAQINGTHVVFAEAPRQGAVIEASYDPERLLDVMRAEKIVLPDGIDWATFRVLINGQAVSLDRLGLSHNSSGAVVLDPNIFLADVDDPFKVVEKSALTIDIYGRVRVP